MSCTLHAFCIRLPYMLISGYHYMLSASGCHTCLSHAIIESFLHQATIHACLRLPYMLSASGYHTCLSQATIHACCIRLPYMLVSGYHTCLSQATIHACCIRLPCMLFASGYHTCLSHARLNRCGSVVQPPGFLENISAQMQVQDVRLGLCF